MEKCIGCELCAGVCPARCIYVRGADNPVDDPVSPGERYGYIYEINYLRCIHCDLCVEACPTEAITESKLFEFSFTNRQDAIYTKNELVVDDDGKPQQLPWEDWREGDDLHTSGWMRATAPSGRGPLRGRDRMVGRARLWRPAPRPAHDADASATPTRMASDGAPVVTGPWCSSSSSPQRRWCSSEPSVSSCAEPRPRRCSLILTLFGIAVLFVALQAHFLAAVQVIVYAGAIVVLFLLGLAVVVVGPGPHPERELHATQSHREVAGERGRRRLGGFCNPLQIAPSRRRSRRPHLVTLAGNDLVMRPRPPILLDDGVRRCVAMEPGDLRRRVCPAGPGTDEGAGVALVVVLDVVVDPAHLPRPYSGSLLSTRSRVADLVGCGPTCDRKLANFTNSGWTR